MSERVIRSEDLLAQMTWVRRLAERLVRDPDEAADLVQETWLLAEAAAVGRPWHPSRLRAWLSRVTRTKARDARRSRARRAGREEMAAQPEAQPSTYDVVERGNLQRQVVDAVLSLDEPYRSTILYRYLDELSVAQVAERTNASEDAVRQRLARGRRALRERLETRLPGGLFVGLAALLGRESAVLGMGTAAGGWTASGATFGAAPAAIGLGVAVTAAAVFVAVLGGTGVENRLETPLLSAPNVDGALPGTTPIAGVSNGPWTEDVTLDHAPAVDAFSHELVGDVPLQPEVTTVHEYSNVVIEGEKEVLLVVEEDERVLVQEAEPEKP